MTGAVVALVALTGSVMAAPLFANPGFETGPTGTTTLQGGSTAITGWTVTGTDIDSLDGYWQNAEGTKSLDLNGFGPGGIEQTFPTTIGATYVVTFSMSGNPGDCVQFNNGVCSPTNKTMTVNATGGTLATYSYDTAATINNFADMKWQVPTAYTFKATSTSTTLSFASTTAGSFGPALDNVVLTQTVATGANCKKGGWQTMVDSAGTSFRNQGDCVSFYATGEKNLAF
jgi:choice-of-anchor C domain-containing protein